MNLSSVLLLFVVVGGLCVVTVVAQTYDPCSRPVSCFSGEILPDPDNCTTYYECKFDSTWKRWSCLSGELFDNITLMCVPAASATCQPSCEPFTGTTVTTLAPEICPGANTTGTCSPSGKKIADISNCAYYFQCQVGKFVRLQCSMRFHYNPVTQQCVPAGSVDCSYRCLTPAPTTAAATTTTTAITTAETTTKTAATATTTSLGALATTIQQTTTTTKPIITTTTTTSSTTTTPTPRTTPITTTEATTTPIPSTLSSTAKTTTITITTSRPPTTDSSSTVLSACTLLVTFALMLLLILP